MEEVWIRGFVGAILVVGFGISGVYRRRAARTDPTAVRSDEPPSLIALRLLVALPMFVVLIGSLTVPSAFGWASLPFPEWLRWVGVGVALMGVPLAAWLFPHLGSNVTATVLVKAEHRLVTTGPYRWVRHPLYLAGLFLVGGAGLALANWVVLGAVVAFVPVWKLIVIPREEAELEKRFGAEHRAYRSSTGALIPRC